MCKKKTHEKFVEEMSLINPNIEIIGKYETNRTPIKCKCKIDGYIWNASPTSLLKSHGCPVCANQVVLEGFNDIPTTAPWMVSYFQGGYDEAKLYTCKSHQKIYPVCPYCGRVKDKPVIIKNIYKINSIGCICSDGKSYPNKFSYAFLSQLPINNWQPEFSPEWAGRYSYDNYFEYNNKKYILEMDGNIGHGNQKWKSKEKDIDGLKRDKIKNDLAKENGISVIRIDCKESNMEYIKNQIIISNDLKQIIKDINIDWKYCDLFGRKNILKEVCTYWESGNYDISKISNGFKLSKPTIANYLKKGSELGLCNYNAFVSFNLKSYHIPVICNGKYAFSSKNSLYKNSESIFGLKIPKSILSDNKNTHYNYKGILIDIYSLKDFFQYLINYSEIIFVE